jgi:hypothetical protein
VVLTPKGSSTASQSVVGDQSSAVRDSSTAGEAVINTSPSVLENDTVMSHFSAFASVSGRIDQLSLGENQSDLDDQSATPTGSDATSLKFGSYRPCFNPSASIDVTQWLNDGLTSEGGMSETSNTVTQQLFNTIDLPSIRRFVFVLPSRDHNLTASMARIILAS